MTPPLVVRLGALAAEQWAEWRKVPRDRSAADNIRRAFEGHLTKVLIHREMATRESTVLGRWPGLRRYKIGEGGRIVYIVPSADICMVLMFGERHQHHEDDAYAVFERHARAGDFDAELDELGLQNPVLAAKPSAGRSEPPTPA